MINDFDVAAKTYDSDFTFSKIGLAQRQIVYSNLSAIFKTKTKLNILELNCGTGYDALNFVKAGHQVIATDISEQMIRTANKKPKSENLTFKTLDITNLNTASFSNKFDVIFSDFGGFNCLTKNEIDNFLKISVKLLNPKGKIILVIMPKLCVWERIYFSIKIQFKKAKRRQTEHFTLANVNGQNVKTWYYNPKDIKVLAEKDFNINTIKPVGLSIPPSYLEHSIVSNTFVLGLFKRLDAVFTSSKLAKYADHFLIELQLK
ncbi:class I SAM-dependent methyltransferase [Olleya sp. Bg11-27]|uniref:class I SAM-dependent methyltransferase n=1 Tax=Olleya sp. Bg11-27 TaxID=2058135 RepID=UPI000C309FA9|nr:class I SAM-dependent methyltransferase [Olleya sp. Bg11-27]AUC77153.1 class I SAM-dependent methyltransferase [Olleya sp. Bg11-27]